MIRQSIAPLDQYRQPDESAERPENLACDSLNLGTNRMEAEATTRGHCTHSVYTSAHKSAQVHTSQHKCTQVSTSAHKCALVHTPSAHKCTQVTSQDNSINSEGDQATSQ